MKKNLLVRILVCIFTICLFLFFHIEKQNELTILGMRIPELSKEVETLNEENTRYAFKIDQFENPMNLLQLVKRQEYSHLKHPLAKHIQMIPEGLALIHKTIPEKQSSSTYKKGPTIVVGAR